MDALFDTRFIKISYRIGFADTKNIAVVIRKTVTKPVLINIVGITVFGHVPKHSIYKLGIFNSVYRSNQHSSF